MEKIGSIASFSSSIRRIRVGLEDKNFNKVIYVDIVTIDKKNALHVVDEDTRYQAAQWPPSMTAEDIRRAKNVLD